MLLWLCFFWDDDDERAYVLWKHWSTTGMSGRLDDHTGGQWRVWTASDAVALRLFPGDWIPADAVAEEVLDLAAVYHPMSVGVDSFRSRQMFQLLGEVGGLQVDLLSQTGRAMHVATERTQTLVGKRRLFHNGDPVARWCASNTEVVKDAMGYPKIVKRDLDANVRIDAMSALTMAVDRMNAWERDGKVDEIKVFTYNDEPASADTPAAGKLKLGI